MIYKLGHQNQTNEFYLFFEHFFFEDEVCAQAKAYKCPARYKKESKEKEPDTLAVCR